MKLPSQSISIVSNLTCGKYVRHSQWPLRLRKAGDTIAKMPDTPSGRSACARLAIRLQILISGSQKSSDQRSPVPGAEGRDHAAVGKDASLVQCTFARQECARTRTAKNTCAIRCDNANGVRTAPSEISKRS
jgi:hypothetical protein